MTLSATSENKSGVARLIAILPFRRRFLRPPSTEAPSLHRSYPASSVLRASPPSQSTRPFSRELPVDPYSDHCWDFPCYVWSPLPACRRHYPGRSDGNLFARTFPSSSAFPVRQVGRLLHQPFRGLLSVYSRYGLHARRVAYATLYTEGFSSFVASAAAPIATGWSEPVPGRDFSPAEDQRLFTAHWRGGLGAAYRLPTLSSVGASLAPPCARFHTPLIEPDLRNDRIRLSEKVSRGRPRKTAGPFSETDQAQSFMENGVRELLGRLPRNSVLATQPLAQPLASMTVHGAVGFADWS